MLKEKTAGGDWGFKKAGTFERAFARLPKPDDPRCKYDERAFHLARLREWLEKMQVKLPEDLKDRMLPFSQADIQLMGQESFWGGNVITAANWDFIPERLLPWSEILPTGDNEYRYWQVSRMEPAGRLLENLALVQIEMNPEFRGDASRYGVKTESEFLLGLAFEYELRILKEHFRGRDKIIF